MLFAIVAISMILAGCTASNYQVGDGIGSLTGSGKDANIKEQIKGEEVSFKRNDSGAIIDFQGKNVEITTRDTEKSTAKNLTEIIN